MKEQLTKQHIGIGLAALAVVCAGYLAWPGKSDHSSTEPSSNQVVRVTSDHEDPPPPKVMADPQSGQPTVTKAPARIVHQPVDVRKPRPRNPDERLKKPKEVVPAG